MGTPTPSAGAQAEFFQGVMREPFLRVWGYVEKGPPRINYYHSLFKFSNPSEDEDGPGEHGSVFGYCGDRDEEDKPQLFKPAQENCHKWKKVKISTDKGAFAAFYADESNNNKWWTPAAEADQPLAEAYLPLTIMLPGALGRLAVAGCTPFEMWKDAGELAGTASLGIEEDAVTLVQDYMLAAC
jgi:hypothetical protein